MGRSEDTSGCTEGKEIYFPSPPPRSCPSSSVSIKYRSSSWMRSWGQSPQFPCTSQSSLSAAIRQRARTPSGLSFWKPSLENRPLSRPRRRKACGVGLSWTSSPEASSLCRAERALGESSNPYLGRLLLAHMTSHSNTP